MRSSNPVLTRLTPETQTGYRSTTGYAQQTDYYSSPVVPVGGIDRMTLSHTYFPWRFE